MAGFGNIQPAVLRRDDGTLVAYMRENGPLRRIRVAESKDDGMTWGPVGAIDLPNPGSGLDAVRLANGHWLLVYNDTDQRPQQPGRFAFRRRRQEPGSGRGTWKTRQPARTTIRPSSKAATARSTPSTATSSTAAKA